LGEITVFHSPLADEKPLVKKKFIHSFIKTLLILCTHSFMLSHTVYITSTLKKKKGIRAKEKFEKIKKKNSLSGISRAAPVLHGLGGGHGHATSQCRVL
jgi:hypothetical protein